MTLHSRALLSNCPEFDDENYEDILAWAETECQAKVSWSDEVYSGRTKKTTRRPELAMWGLVWKFGAIGFDWLPNEADTTKARQAAALFIFLWSLGVSAGLADRLASAYVLHGYEITTIGGDDDAEQPE